MKAGQVSIIKAEIRSWSITLFRGGSLLRRDSEFFQVHADYGEIVS